MVTYLFSFKCLQQEHDVSLRNEGSQVDRAWIQYREGSSTSKDHAQADFSTFAQIHQRQSAACLV